MGLLTWLREFITTLLKRDTTPLPARTRRSLTLSVRPLEERRVLNADLASALIATDAALELTTTSDGGNAETSAPDAVGETVSQATDLVEILTQPDRGEFLPQDWTSALDSESSGALDVELTNSPAATDVVFIDGRVDEADLLAAGVREGIDVVFLDTQSDGLTQITDFLNRAEYQNGPLSAIHIVSHGQSGKLWLGSTELTNENLDRFSSQLSKIGSSLTETGDLLFYGCNVAAGARGESFLQNVAALTGADVAASIDLTGATFLGGDWDLEATTGAVEAQLAFSLTAQQQYESVLAAFVVNTTDDTSDANPGDGVAEDASGKTSLRAAIEEANALSGDDTITFDATLTGQTIRLNGTQLPTILDNLTITGLGADQLAINGDMNLDGIGDSRLLEIDAAATVDISGLMITKGQIDGANGGAILNRGTLTMDQLVLAGNVAMNGDGGGLFNDGGTVVITNSEISGNTAIGSVGAGIYNNAGNLTLINSTLANNQSIQTNGIVGGLYNDGTATLINSTVAGNSGGSQGNGVFNVSGRNLTLENTILADNLGGSLQDLLAQPGSTVTARFSLIENGSTSFAAGSVGNITGVDPMLGSLQDNGGSTRTLALMPGSVAIDAGSNILAVDQSNNPLTTDQRGTGFVRRLDGDGDVTATVDIGAFEAPKIPPIPETSIALNGAGDLLISDIRGANSADTLSLRVDPSDATRILITDPNNVLGAGPGLTQVDPFTVSLLISDITSNQIQIQTHAGADSVTIDTSLLAAGLSVDYDGGAPAASPGDSLTVTDMAGTGFASLTYDATIGGSGTLTFNDGMANLPVITFTGLEPVTVTAVAGVVTLNVDDGEMLPGNALAVSLTDDGDPADGQMRLDLPPGFEDLVFQVPSVELIINGDADADETITIASVDNSFASALTIDGQGGTDTITVDTALTLGGNLSATAETINVQADISTDNGNDAANILFTGDVVIGANLAFDTNDNNAVNGDHDGTFTVTGSFSSVGKTVTFDVGTSDLTLTNAGNDFGTLVINSANAASLHDTNGFTLGDISTVAGLSIEVDAGDTVTQGAATAITGTGGLAKTGAGTLILSESGNNFSGDVSLLDGVLKTAGTQVIPDGVKVQLATGATLDLNGNDESIDRLTGTGTVTSSAAGSASTLSLGVSGGSSTFSGLIEDGAGTVSLVKAGAGSFTLTGTNTFTGTTTLNSGLFHITSTGSTDSATTLNGGVLAVDGEIDASVTVNAGTLQGTNGTITGPVMINAGGTLAPGSSPGILNTGSLSLTSGASFDVEINGLTTAGTDYDQLAVTGTVSLGNATLNLIDGFAGSGTLGDTLLLIDNDGTDAVSGTFNGLANGANVSFNGETWRIFYDGGDGNDVVLTFVPSAIPMVFVNDDFVHANGIDPGDTITDADPNTAGNQMAVLGVTAFASVQAGVNAVDAGGTVFVTDTAVDGDGYGPSAGTGTYNEAVTINKNDITLTGTSGNAGDVLIMSATGNAVTVASTVTNVTISHLSVHSTFDDGIDAIGVSGNVFITNVIASNNAGDGIEITNAASATITDSVASGNAERGIFITGVDDVLLTSVAANDNTLQGAQIVDAMSVQVDNTAMTPPSQFSGNAGVGLLLDRFDLATISAADADANGSHGIQLIGNSRTTSIAIVGLPVVGGGAGGQTHFGNGADGLHAEKLDELVVNGGSWVSNAGDGVEAFNINNVTIDQAIASKNAGHGYNLADVGDVIFTDVIAVGNDPGLFVNGAASFSDTDGTFSGNADHGIQLIDIAGDVTLVRTTLEDNDSDNDGIGDGLNATDGADADNTAIGGNLLIQGATIRRTNPALTHQQRGLFVDRLAGSATFQDSTVTVQSVKIIDNQAAGIELTNVSGAVSLTDVTADGNAQEGLVVGAAASAAISGGSFSNNSAEGIDLKNITNGVTLSNNVVASGNVGEGLLVDSAGSVSVTGGMFNDSTASNGITLSSITGGAVVLDGLTANNNAAGGLSVTTADSLTLTGVTSTGNGANSIVSNVMTVTLNTTQTAGMTDDIVDLNTDGTNGSSNIGGAGNWRLTRGGSVQNIVSFSGVTTLNINTLGGDDTVNAFAHATTAINLDGGAPTSSPGDSLRFFTPSPTVTPTGAGITLQTSGNADLFHVNFESAELRGAVVFNGTNSQDNTLSILATGEDTASYTLESDGTLVDAGTLVSLTGLTFNGLGGDDVLVIRQPDGDFFNPMGGVLFHGGSQDNDGNSLTGTIPSLLGDTLVIESATSNAVTAQTIETTFAAASVPAEGDDGLITITDAILSDGSTTIQFTGLEPVLDNLDADNRIFTFNAGSETITLSAPGLGGLDNQIDSTLGESVSFNNPNLSLTINAGSGDDIVNVDSIDAGYRAALTINGDGNATATGDTVNLNTSLTLGDATAGNTGNLTVHAETIVVDAVSNGNIAIDTTPATTNGATGNVAFTAGRRIVMNSGSRITTLDGDVTFLANVAGTATGNFIGIMLTDADITTGMGATNLGGEITLNGRGGETGNNNIGVRLQMGASVNSTGIGTSAGNISITGRASGVDSSEGVSISDAGTIVQAVDGDITIVGTSMASEDRNQGIEILQGAVIRTTGTGANLGNITLQGTGSGNIDGDDSEGILISGAGTAIRTVDGDISITGTSTATDDNNVGVDIEFGAVIQTTGTGADAGLIHIMGTGSGGTSSEGIQIEDVGTLISVVDGDLEIIGMSTGTASGNEGVEIQGGARVLSTGTGTSAGTIKILGTGSGTNSGEGVQIEDGGTLVRSVDGKIEIRGSSTGSGTGNVGVEILLGADVISTGVGANAAAIVIDGTGNGVSADGVFISDAGTRVTTSGGDIDIGGNSSSSGSNSNGVLISNSALVQASADGSIDIFGLSTTDGSGSGNGVVINTASLVEIAMGGTGSITVTGRDGSNANDAAVLISNATLRTDTTPMTVTGVNQNVQMLGTAEVQSNSGSALIQSSNDVLLTLVNLDRDVSGARGTARITADADTSAFIGGTASDSDGRILDNLASETANIIAGAAALRAATGIGDGIAGSSADIDTVTSTLAAVTDSGDINIRNTGSLTIGMVDGLTGVTITDGNDDNSGVDHITLIAASPAIVDAAIINHDGGDITLAAQGASNSMVGQFSAADDDLQINADISAMGGHGDIRLFAGGDLLQTSGTISAVGSGMILLSAGEDFNNGTNQNGHATASVVMSETALVASDLGMITVRATEHVILGRITSNGTVVVTADFDGVGSGLADGTGSINDNGGNTTIDVAATAVDFNAASGIGESAEIETSVSMLSADSTDGDIDIDNTSASTVTVTSLTTGTNMPAAIRFDQSGGGDVLFTGTVSSGTNGSVDGGDITLTSTAGLTVGAAATVQSLDDVGGAGTLTISGATIDGAVTVGAGNIVIQGGALDTIIAAALNGVGPINLSALRDVLIQALVTTTAGDVNITADTDGLVNMDGFGSAQGGVLVAPGGFIDGPADVTIRGSDLLNLGAASGTVESVQIDADSVAGSNQILADGQILISSHGMSAPASADILINGRVESTSSSMMSGSAPIQVTANEDVIFNNAALAASNDGSLNAPGLVLVTASSGAIIDAESGAESPLITAASTALRAATGIGDGTAGDAADIDTAIFSGASTLTLAAVTDSGDINIQNTGSLTIGMVDGLAGVTITDSNDDDSGSDDITLVAASPAIVNAAIINRDGGDINVTAMGSSAGDDVVINADLQVTDVAAAGNAGRIVVTAGSDIVHNAGTVSTVGGNMGTLSGDILYDAEETIRVGDTAAGNAAAVLRTVGGDVKLNADPSAAMTPNANALTISDAATSAGREVLIETVSGQIRLNGLGASGLATSMNRGVSIESGSVIRSTGTGASVGVIFISGTGGAGLDQNDGIRVTGAGTQISSVDGDIQLSGQGQGTGQGNDGVVIEAGAVVRSTGTGAMAGSIQLTGFGANGTDDNLGVRLDGAGTLVTSTDGAITIQGTTQGDGNQNAGVGITGGSVVNAAGTANVSVSGSVVHAEDNNTGVLVSDANSEIRAAGGGIMVMGTSDSNGAMTSEMNIGVALLDGAKIKETSATGTVTVSGTGGDGQSMNYGLFLGNGASIETAGGGSTLDGSGNSNGMGGSGNFGIFVQNSLVSDSAQGAITLTGRAAAGTQEDVLLDQAGSGVQSTTGNITITALRNDLAMTNSAVVLSDAGDALLQAAENVRLGIVNLDNDGVNGAGIACILADADTSGMTGGIASDGTGQIVDNLATEAANITAAEALLRAGSGIGDGLAGDPNDIDTATAPSETEMRLAARTDTGDINLQHVGPLTVEMVKTVSGIEVTDSANDNSGNDVITLLSSGNLTTNKAIVNQDAGDVVLRSTGAAVAIQGAVTTPGGQIDVDAATNVTSQAAGTMTTTPAANSGVNSGIVTVHAGNGGTGNIDLNGTIDTQGASNNSGPGRDGGMVMLVANAGTVHAADILTSGGSSTSGGAGGQAGLVDIQADGNVTIDGTTGIVSRGGDGAVGFAGGIGGTQTIDSTNGGIFVSLANTSGGNGDMGGNAANAVYTAGDFITVTTLLANGGEGSSNAGGMAADVSLTAGGPIMVVDRIDAAGGNALGMTGNGGAGGEVQVRSVGGAVDLKDLDVSGGDSAAAMGGSSGAIDVTNGGSGESITLRGTLTALGGNGSTADGPDGVVSLISGASLLDADDSRTDVLADRLQIQALSGIAGGAGLNQMIEFDVAAMAASSAAGNIGLHDDDSSGLTRLANLIISEVTADVIGTPTTTTGLMAMDGAVSLSAVGSIRVIDTDGGANDAMDITSDPEIIGLGDNGGVTIMAGRDLFLQDNVQIHAANMALVDPPDAPTTVEQGSAVVVNPQIVSLEAQQDVRFGDQVEIRTFASPSGSVVGIARLIAPRPDLGPPPTGNDTAFYDADSISSPAITREGSGYAARLKVTIGQPGETGLAIMIDWGTPQADRVETVTGLVGGTTYTFVHRYTEQEIVDSRIRRGSATEPISVNFAVMQESSILIRGNTVTTADGLTTIEPDVDTGNPSTADGLDLLSSTDLDFTTIGSPDAAGVFLENGAAEFDVPNIDIVLPSILFSVELPTEEKQEPELPLPSIVTEAIITSSTDAATATFAIGRDEYLELRVVSPDPQALPLAVRRLPDEFLAGKEGLSFKDLFDGLPDGTYEIWYVLGTNNQLLIRVQVRGGSAMIRDDALEGERLKLEEIRDKVREQRERNTTQTDEIQVLQAAQQQLAEALRHQTEKPFAVPPIERSDVMPRELPSDPLPEGKPAEDLPESLEPLPEGQSSRQNGPTGPEEQQQTLEQTDSAPVGSVVIGSAAFRTLRGRRANCFGRSRRAVQRIRTGNGDESHPRAGDA